MLIIKYIPFKGFNILINIYSSSKDYIGSHLSRGGIEFIKEYFLQDKITGF